MIASVSKKSGKPIYYINGLGQSTTTTLHAVGFMGYHGV